MNKVIDFDALERANINWVKILDSDEFTEFNKDIAYNNIWVKLKDFLRFKGVTL